MLYKINYGVLLISIYGRKIVVGTSVSVFTSCFHFSPRKRPCSQKLTPNSQKMKPLCHRKLVGPLLLLPSIASSFWTYSSYKWIMEDDPLPQQISVEFCTHTASVQAELLGISILYPFSNIRSSSIGLIPAYGTFPPLNISQQVTPNAHWKEILDTHLLCMTVNYSLCRG